MQYLMKLQADFISLGSWKSLVLNLTISYIST